MIMRSLSPLVTKSFLTGAMNINTILQKRIVEWRYLSPLTISLLGGLFALLIYLSVAWFLLPAYALWSPDEGAKLLQLQSLDVENRHLVYTIPYHGRTFDPELRFAQWELLRIRDDQLSFGRLPIFPLVSRPFVSMLGLHGLYILPALGGSLISVLVLRLWPDLSPKLPVWLLVAFGSPVFIYATLFWEHTLATALVLAGSMLVLRIDPIVRPCIQQRLLCWFCIAMLFAASAYIRPETILLTGALLASVWLLTPNKRWSVFYTGALMSILLLPYFPLHQIMFAGQALPDNASHIFVPFAYIRGAGLQAISDLFVGPFTHGAVKTGWSGSVWGAAAVVAIGCGFCYQGVWRNTMLFVALALNVMIAAFFLMLPEYYRSGHGLLFTTPWAILGLCRSREIWGSQSYYLRVCLVSVFLGLAVYALAILVLRGSSPHGGLQWGTRFALSFYPLLAILALWNWDSQRYNNALLASMILLIVLGFGFQVRGLWTIWNDKWFNGRLNQTIADLPESYILSDLNWLPLNAAPIYNQKVWFVAETPESIDAWVDQAARQNLSGFGVVTMQNTVMANVLERVLAEHAFQVVAVNNDMNSALILHIRAREYARADRTSSEQSPICAFPVGEPVWCVTVQVGWSGGALPLAESLFSARCGGFAATTGRKEGFAEAGGPR